MRTFRIGIVNAFSSASVPIGNALSGIVYTNLGFYGVYSIAMAMYAMGFLYGSFYIVETRPETTGFEKSKEQTPVTRSSSYLDFFRDLFSLDHIREGVRVTFKKGQRNRRLRVCLLVVVYVAVSGPFYGPYAALVTHALCCGQTASEFFGQIPSGEARRKPLARWFGGAGGPPLKNPPGRPATRLCIFNTPIQLDLTSVNV